MRSFIFIIVFVLISISIFSLEVDTVVVLEDKVNIRSGPSISSSVVGKVNSGELLQVVRADRKPDKIGEDVNAWYPIVGNDSKVLGFVWGKFIGTLFEDLADFDFRVYSEIGKYHEDDRGLTFSTASLGVLVGKHLQPIKLDTSRFFWFQRALVITRKDQSPLLWLNLKYEMGDGVTENNEFFSLNIITGDAKKEFGKYIKTEYQ